MSPPLSAPGASSPLSSLWVTQAAAACSSLLPVLGPAMLDPDSLRMNTRPFFPSSYSSPRQSSSFRKNPLLIFLPPKAVLTTA